MKPHEIIAITGIRKASIILAIRKYINYGYTLEAAVKKAKKA